MTPSSETPPAVTGYAGDRSEPAEPNSKDHPMPQDQPIETLASEVKAAAEALAAWDRYEPDVSRGEIVRQAVAMAEALRGLVPKASVIFTRLADSVSLQDALRSIDACGGTFSPEDTESRFAEGYSAALDEAEKALKRLGGEPYAAPPNVLTLTTEIERLNLVRREAIDAALEAQSQVIDLTAKLVESEAREGALREALQKMRGILRSLQPAMNVMAREVMDDIIRDQIDPALTLKGRS